MNKPGCRFCLANGLLTDEPLLRRERFFVLGSIESHRPAQVMVVPLRHMESPFELTAEEWSDLRVILNLAREHLMQFRPDGFTLGWNVGAVAGQSVFHSHLHVIARFAGEPTEGRGIHYALRHSGS